MDKRVVWQVSEEEFVQGPQAVLDALKAGEQVVVKVDGKVGMVIGRNGHVPLPLVDDALLPMQRDGAAEQSSSENPWLQ